MIRNARNSFCASCSISRIYVYRNLKGHSVVLDVFATDSRGHCYDIEMQRASQGAAPRRARYNSSLIDAQTLLPGSEYSLLPESYVIFITEKDALKKGLPICHIDRMIQETGETFGDGAHIIYANASMQDDTRLGKLMADFTCTEPEQMHYKILADRTKYFKYQDEGVSHMCQFWQELKEEGRAEAEKEILEMKNKVQDAEARVSKAEIRNLALKNAFKMLLSGKLTVEEIAEYTNLPLEEIMEFAALTSK